MQTVSEPLTPGPTPPTSESLTADRPLSSARHPQGRSSRSGPGPARARPGPASAQQAVDRRRVAAGGAAAAASAAGRRGGCGARGWRPGLSLSLSFAGELGE